MLFILILNGQHFSAIVSWWDRYKQKFKLSFVCVCASNVSITCFTCISIFPKPKQSCIPSCMRFKGVIVSLMLSVWKKRFIFYKRSVICKAEKRGILACPAVPKHKIPKPSAMFLSVRLFLSLPHPSFAKPDQFFSLLSFCFPLFFSDWPFSTPPPLYLSPPPPPPLSLALSLPLSCSTPCLFLFTLSLSVCRSLSLASLQSHKIWSW